MGATEQRDTVFFSVKGQVVIPSRLRRAFGIKKGTRALVWAERDRIILKPITEKHVQSLRGSLRDKGVMEAVRSDEATEKGSGDG
ncbi:MAG: AbrB/MazE/SpoVT family DNA-binding domain-containing protein [Lentisphaerae bacterium]|nr:AbrB/MazE/SpoVT family DNA-binding domain-containing protein [Lentisphaerota bacterium]